MAMLSGVGRIENKTVCIILFILPNHPIVLSKNCLNLETLVVPSISFIFLFGSVISFCLGLSFALSQFMLAVPTFCQCLFSEYTGLSSYLAFFIPDLYQKGYVQSNSMARVTCHVARVLLKAFARSTSALTAWYRSSSSCCAFTLDVDCGTSRESDSWQTEHNLILSRNKDEATGDHLHQRSSGKMSLTAGLLSSSSLFLLFTLQLLLYGDTSRCFVSIGSRKVWFIYMYVCMRISTA